jgi:peptide/nickel transport system permease protein
MKTSVGRPLAASYALLGFLGFVALFGGLLAGVVPTGLALLLSAIRSTVAVAAFVFVLSLLIGLGAAALAAAGPPAFDVILSWLVEVAGALPSVVVVVVFGALMRTSSIVAIGVFLALKRGLESAKVVRAELLQLGGEEFVLAAKAAGIGEARLFRRHYLPHVAPSAVARSTLGVAAVVSLDAAGSFLGIFRGSNTFGTLIAEAARRSSFALFVGPAVGTAVMVAALAIVADAIGDRNRLGRRFLS